MKIENVLIPKEAIMEQVEKVFETQFKDEMAKQGITGITVHSIEWEAEGLRLFFSEKE